MGSEMCIRDSWKAGSKKKNEASCSRRGRRRSTSSASGWMAGRASMSACPAVRRLADQLEQVAVVGEILRVADEQQALRPHAGMQPQAMLFVGHSENFADHRDLFQLVGKTAYRRAA